MSSGIYVISTPHNGMLYIGMSEVDWRKRWQCHFAKARTNRYLSNVIAKHGRSCAHVWGWDTDNPLVVEQWLINFFGGENSTKLYNSQAGGGRSSRLSEAAKEKVRAFQKGRKQTPTHLSNRAASIRAHHDRLRAWKSACGVPWVWWWKPRRRLRVPR